MYPVVNRESCEGCENCVEICPSEVYVIADGKPDPVHPEDCIECGACVDQCPTGSIELRDD
jgi:NAD-dependent dihydropyrimidine dehydrogenase PreA subunit